MKLLKVLELSKLVDENKTIIGLKFVFYINGRAYTRDENKTIIGLKLYWPIGAFVYYWWK